MSQQTVSAQDTGRSCPYCRFPFKFDGEAYACDVCGALHHADCWRDGGGCAVFGCAGAGVTGTQATATEPTPAGSIHAATSPTDAADAAMRSGNDQISGPGAPAKPVFAPPIAANLPPSGSDSGPKGRQGMLLGVLIAVAITAAALVAYFVASSSHGSRVVTVTTAGATTASSAGGPPTSTPASTQTQPAGPPPDQVLANKINGIVQFSKAGRAAVQTGDYSAAIANRTEALRRLNALGPTDAKLGPAISSLRQALTASLHSDEAYASGGDPTTYDAQATQFKTQFVQRWSAIASSYGLPQYDPTSI